MKIKILRIITGLGRRESCMREGFYFGGVVFFLIHLLLFFPTASAESVPAGPALEFTDDENAAEIAVAKIKPALVRLHVVTVYDDQGREVKYESVGSGVIITEEGHIITNHHVAGRAKRIVCTLANKEEIEAELVGTDPLADISVVKLLPNKKRKFPFAQFGDSDELKVGDRVFAMGSPLALSQSVTSGIVSNTELVIPEVFWPFRFTLEGEDVGSLVRWIGHDAAIYPGNSGGPLVNAEGDIVGINEISLGIGGAIPGNLAKKIASELIAHGRVRRSWFGFEVQPLLKHGNQKEGILISGVIDGSPAQDAGFSPGDVLVRFKGKDICVRFAEELPMFNQLLMDCPIGEPVEAVVIRNGAEITLHVTPREREYVLPKTVELKKWGITVRDVSLFIAKELKRDNQDGVLVTSVRPGGPCGEAKPAVIQGDIIVRVNDRSIRNVKELVELTEKITDITPMLVTFERKDERHLTVVEVGIKEVEAQGEELRKAWLGVAIQVLTKDIARSLGIEGCKGVRITQVFKKTPAERAGIKVGDIIVAVDGDSVSATNPADIDVFPVMIRRHKIGSRVVLTVLRDDKKFDLTVELGKSPVPPNEVKRYRDTNFELVVRDIAFMDRVEQKWDDKMKGVLVDEVSSGGWAALAHLAVGDLIVMMDNKTVADVESFRRIMSEVKEKKSRSVVLQVIRGIHSFFIEIEPNWEQGNR